MLISDLTFKLLLDIQRYMVNGEEEPTDLLKYAAQCEWIYQKLKDIACMMAAVKRSKEKQALNTLTAKKVATSTTIIQTTSSTKPNRQLRINKQDWLMKKARCFTCN